MERPAPTCAAVLAALADLAPGGAARRRSLLDVTTAGRSLVWLGNDIEIGALLEPALTGQRDDEGAVVPPAQVEAFKRLAAADALHREEHLLRVGWIWLAGTVHDDEVGSTPVLHPLLAAPVRPASGMLDRFGGGSRLLRDGDVELTPLAGGAVESLEAEVPFPPRADELTDASLERFPALTAWVRRVVAACGLGDVPVVSSIDPQQRRGADGLVAVAGAGLYLGRAVDAVDLGSALRSWSTSPGLGGTSLAAILAPEDLAAPPPPAAPSFEPPMELSAAQHDAVRRARTEQVVVVAGPAGTGKSHVAAAVALDALAAGRSVLVAAQTEHAVDVLADRFVDLPGPPPVVFGGSERRRELAAGLAAGLDDGVDQRALARLRATYESAAQRCHWTLDAVHGLLDRERRAARSHEELGSLAQVAAPGVFAPSVDLDEARRLLDRASSPSTGWWGARRRRRAEALLRRSADASEAVPLDRLRDAIEVATDRRIAAELAASGGTRIGDGWSEVERAAAAQLEAAGALLGAECRSGAARGRPARQSAQALATALRASRSARRRLLRDLDAAALLHAFPLWLGTLRDVDDLLPSRTAMFDVVVLDEASQIDLPRAATALARAGRAVVVGDPHQLRHVSFVADAAVDDVLREHRLPPSVRTRLDVRRSSAFDAATSVAAPVWLEEHFRSVPHLVDFPAARFSPVPVHVVTRHPRNDAQRAIAVRRVDGVRGADGHNDAEVDAALAEVQRLCAEGCRSVGLLTPLRAQADALERAVLDRFTLDDIERHGLRVGTVHAFQGNERDVVVLSVVLDDDAPAASRRFVEDPNLFNVMVTRARQQLVVVTSLRNPPPGLLADFLAHADRPPRAPRGPTTDQPQWVSDLAAELERAGFTVRRQYQVGAMAVDLVVGDGIDAVGLECVVHPAGPTAHIVRHRLLRRLGWRLVEAWPTRFDGDVARAGVVLAGELAVDR